jgi:hypothetical protein
MFLRLCRVASAARAVARAGVSGEEAARVAAWAEAAAAAEVFPRAVSAGAAGSKRLAPHPRPDPSAWPVSRA